MRWQYQTVMEVLRFAAHVARVAERSGDYVAIRGARYFIQVGIAAESHNIKTMSKEAQFQVYRIEAYLIGKLGKALAPEMMIRRLP